MKRFTWGWRRTNEAFAVVQVGLIALELAGVTHLGWGAVFLPLILVSCFFLIVAIVATIVIAVDDR